MTSKTITSLKSNGNPWGEPPNGPLYPFKVEFDDGMTGVANTKTQVPPYKVGDVVGVEVTGQDKRGNNKLKIDRKWPSQNPGATGSAFPDKSPANGQQSASNGPSGAGSASSATAVIHPATAGCAFKAAVDVLGAGATDPKAVHKLASSYVRVLQALEAGKLALPPEVVAAQEAAKAVGFEPRKEEEDVPF